MMALEAAKLTPSDFQVASIFAERLPSHACGLYLEHNPQRDVYETVAEWDKDNGDCWASDAERAVAIERNELWLLHWYPDTPIGFFRVAASTLPAVLLAAKET